MKNRVACEPYSCSENRFEAMLARAGAGGTLTESDLRVLLNTRDPNRIDALFQTARLLRRRHFDDRVFLYGFVYASTFCRNDCTFCFYRKSNPLAPRYRKNSDDIVGSALRLKHSGVHLIYLTLGEDPVLSVQGRRRRVATVDRCRYTRAHPGINLHLLERGTARC